MFPRFLSAHGFDPRRRNLLRWLGGAGLIGPLSVSTLARVALAMGQREYPQGMRLVEGPVKINGVPATVGAAVRMGDTVATGDFGKTVFVVERSVYMLRENTEMTLSRQPEDSGKEHLVSLIKLISGGMLAVFGKGERRLMTHTAVIGIRGTAVYLETDPQKTYVCTCYGRAEIVSVYDKTVRESVKTYHHEKPRFVFGAGAENILVEAPVFNHTDNELIMLESLVGRVPPFVKPHTIRRENGDDRGY